jgi:Tol biopolymer transport system component
MPRVGAVASAAVAVILADPDPSIYRTAVQSHPGPIDAPLAAVSGDGAFVAFESLAQLVPADTNATHDIYVLHVSSGSIELASVSPDGAASNGSSSRRALSHDGRFLVFESVASDITPDGQPSCPTRGTVFLRDRHERTTRAIARASTDPSRVVCADQPAISSDGSTIAFASTALDLVADVDANGIGRDVYVVEKSTGVTSRISVDHDGRQHAAGTSFGPAISADGRYVAFTSTACLDRQPSIETRGGDPCPAQVYVRDRAAGRTRAVMGMAGNWPDGPTYGASISVDGRYVAFTSTATNLVRQRVGSNEQVYLYDLERGVSELVSRTPRGKPGNGPSSRPAVAGAGRFIAFQSVASDLTCAGRCPPAERDYNLVSDVFLLDRQTARMRRLSRGPGSEAWWAPSVGPAIDAAGRVVAFSSRHPTGPEDESADFDLRRVASGRISPFDPLTLPGVVRIVLVVAALRARNNTSQHAWAESVNDAISLDSLFQRVTSLIARLYRMASHSPQADTPFCDRP